MFPVCTIALAGDAGDRDFAAAWQALPKWVVSRTPESVGANATLIAENVDAFAHKLKKEVDGDIDVAGPTLAASLTDLGLIDDYRLYFRPFVLGRGKPYFAAARPPLGRRSASLRAIALARSRFG